MKKYSMKFLDWDLRFEGEVVSLAGTLRPHDAKNDMAFRAHDGRKVKDIRKNFFRRCRRIVLAGRRAGLSDAEMRWGIHTNFVCYGFDDKAFPFDKLLAPVKK